MDDIQINGDSQAEVSWSPTTELYSNSIATLPYSHTPGAKDVAVWAKPTVSRTYTATATGGASCNKTGSSVITVTASSTLSVSIAAAGGTTICAGDAVTFTATVVNGNGNPGFIWRKNGVQVNGPTNPEYNQNPRSKSVHDDRACEW